MDRDARKHVTCLVNTDYTGVVDDENEELYTRGGGVCIHKDGLIVTAAHVLPESGTVQVRMYDDVKGRPAIVADRWDNYDVAILWIKKHYEDEEFMCVTVPEDVGLNYGEELFAFLHQSNCFHSYADGHVAFPVGPGFPLPDPEDPVTMVTDGIEFLGIDDAFNETFYPRTAGHITDNDDSWAEDYHPELPLLHMQGFNVEAGSSGCPVFRGSDNAYVGTILGTKSPHDVAVPVQFVSSLIGPIHLIHRPMVLVFPDDDDDDDDDE